MIFEASATYGRLCVDISITDDLIDECDEQFLVKFGNILNAGVGAISEACIIITDDDG